MFLKKNNTPKKLITSFSIYFTSYPLRLFLLPSLLMLMAISAYGGFEDLYMGSRAVGMGSAYVAIADGPETIFFNPAGLSQSSGTSLSFYISHPYGIKELSVEALSSIIQTRYGQLGITIQTFGGSHYRENTFTLGFGHQFIGSIHMGFLIRAVHLQIIKYGSDIALTIGGGILFKPTNRLTWGFSITNINHAAIGKQKDPIPRITRLGIACCPVENTSISLEIDKDTRFPLELKGGLEICPIAGLSLRCGFGREPSTVSGGFGLAWNIFSLDYSLSIHPILGTSHHGSLSINLKKEP